MLQTLTCSERAACSSFSAARTRAGENTLAAWPLSGAPADEIGERQDAVAEVRPRLDLREELNVLAMEISVGNHLETLAEWGKADPLLLPRHTQGAPAGQLDLGNPVRQQLRLARDHERFPVNPGCVRYHFGLLPGVTISGQQRCELA
jgi:hypothetical protein